MAFGNISTFYIPRPADAGSSMWGTDVRKVLGVQPSAQTDGSTTMNFGTGGAVTRTVDPYTGHSGDLDQTLYGWAIDPTDMGSVVGAKRFFPAGNHVSRIHMSHNTAIGATGTLTSYIYRVGPAAGRTRTLLGSDTASVVLPATSGAVNAVVTVALPEVIFEADETIQYSYEFNVAGVAITGRIVTFITGWDNADLAARVTTPVLGVLADTTGTANGVGTVSGETSKVLSTEGAAIGTGDAAGIGAARADTTGSSFGLSEVTGATSAVAGTTGSASGSVNVSGQILAIGSMTGTSTGTSSVTGTMGATGSMIGASTGTGTASGAFGARADMVGTATGVGDATASASSVAGTTGSATGVGIATGQTSKVLGTVGTVEIGTDSEETIVIVKRPIYLFDD